MASQNIDRLHEDSRVSSASEVRERASRTFSCQNVNGQERRTMSPQSTRAYGPKRPGIPSMAGSRAARAANSAKRRPVFQLTANECFADQVYPSAGPDHEEDGSRLMRAPYPDGRQARTYFSLAYSALASLKIGGSGSASLQSVNKFW